jgi:hypothetical protein
MTTLVERLRDVMHETEILQMCEEAADEIERLLGALETCRELRKLDALEINSLRGASRLSRLADK